MPSKNSSSFTMLITAEEFNGYMESLAPFEYAPLLAVAVSGGSDSLCLALLLHKWVQEKKGRLIALTVDHGLRPESSKEAVQVGKWLGQYGIEHHILPWIGRKPSARIQENARHERYRLLETWCKRHNILHLCTGHQAQDQEETFLFRLCRGSGIDGLAAIAAIVEKQDLRILRPLLKVSRERLRLTLLSIQQEWVEDPSNTDRHYTRTRLRQLQKTLEPEGLGSALLAKTIHKLALSRVSLEHQTALALAKSVQLFPTGYALIDLRTLLKNPEEILLRVLSATLTCISGKLYPPRRIYLEGLKNELVPDIKLKGKTCWGCSIIQWREKLLIIREAASISQQIRVNRPENTIKWDNRFTLVFDQLASKPFLKVSKLGTHGWAQIANNKYLSDNEQVLPRVRPTLPAIWYEDNVIAVPHLNYYGTSRIFSSKNVRQIFFSPLRALCNQPFTVS